MHEFISLGSGQNKHAAIFALLQFFAVDYGFDDIKKFGRILDFIDDERTRVKLQKELGVANSLIPFPQVV